MSQGSDVDASVLESIRYRGVQDFTLLDQRVLPSTVKYDKVETLEDTWNAIKEMRVRGAPAIAVTAMLGIAVTASKQTFATVADAAKYLNDALEYISTSRPTAVNLFNAVAQFKAFVGATAATNLASPQDLVTAFVGEAERLLREDTQLNEGIMRHGAAYLLQHCKRADGDSDGLAIVTICNTGSLATSKFGTALGVIRELHYQKKLQQVYSLETRPWNQGARLTVFECLHERMPTTLLCDSAVSFLMSRRQISACIVGADRICQNGDTANKIGTYDLAVAAKYHGVPFFVAAPTTTLDAKTADGSLVHIEERTPVEITHNVATGQRAIAEDPHGLLTVWNPVFDIVPGALITGGIITEKGVVPPKAEAPYFDIAAIIAS